MIDYDHLDELVYDSLRYLRNLCYRGDPAEALEVAIRLEALYHNAVVDIHKYTYHAEGRLQRGEKSTILDVTSLKTIDDRLCLKDPEKIQQYITLHIQLEEILPEAIKIARKHLPDATFVMYVYQDPEFCNDKYLVIEVQLEDYPDDIREKIQNARREIDSLLDPEDYFLIMLMTFFSDPEEVE